jgi:hypothetical protein
MPLEQRGVDTVPDEERDQRGAGPAGRLVGWSAQASVPSETAHQRASAVS